MPGERRIGPLALDFLWEALGAGELPYPLEVRSHGATMDERAALRRRVSEDLVSAGLIDHGGRLEPELEDWFGVLAQPDLSIDSVFLPELDAPPVLALAAAGRAGAVLAVQHRQELRLRPIPRDGLVSAIVAMLPGAPRGTEQSISVPAAELAAVPAGAAQRTSDVETRKALATLTAMPNRRGGQIGVNSRTDVRGRRRSPVLSWFDNDSGRYLTQTRDGWATFAPADAATLRHRIGELATQLTADRR
ncbi:ESX secretion-associated protein EspG [Actinophytocola gossypii]|uniref:ESX secretion-associated protein EspG n=1 Tax=Actinophytocola gossypii TaxID=2812003 RepID=A0ABT2J3V0_9PSEU|nr:ESX secretion-associated protein EspG [Actinophytocola gossypii]MCT2582537.1 ESX secretion-associated protein EspG [Actinophytocola gossypii]